VDWTPLLQAGSPASRTAQRLTACHRGILGWRTGLSYTGTFLTASRCEGSGSLIPTVFPPFACVVAAELSAPPRNGEGRWPPASRVQLARLAAGTASCPTPRTPHESAPSRTRREDYGGHGNFVKNKIGTIHSVCHPRESGDPVDTGQAASSEEPLLDCRSSRAATTEELACSVCSTTPPRKHIAHRPTRSPARPSPPPLSRAVAR
jgi:hypothetical protein